ncbi:UNVERIFIED_CONTAM: hypothetical protein ABIC26_002955 [Paenibacillus sp. PvR008]
MTTIKVTLEQLISVSKQFELAQQTAIQMNSQLLGVTSRNRKNRTLSNSLHEKNRTLYDLQGNPVSKSQLE